MMFERFVIGQSRRAAIACVIQERSQVPQGADMRAIALDDLDVGIPRLVIAPKHVERTGTREKQRDVVRSLS